MYEFIFLGLIPGTHIQVTFSVWTGLAGVIAGIVLVRRAVRYYSWRFSYQHGKFLVPGRR